MKHSIFIILCFLCQSVYAADVALQDSLLKQLVNSTNTYHKTGILRNLADIYYQQVQEENYLKLLVSETKKAGNKVMLIDALGDLTEAYITDGKSDSAQYCMDEIARLDNSTASVCWQTLLRMSLFEAELKKGGEFKIEAINKELAKRVSGSNKNIYRQIEDAYIIARGFDIQKKSKEALPYAVTALNLAASLPFKEGFKIRMCVVSLVKLLYIRCEEFEKVNPLMEEYLKLMEEHYQEFLKKNRPFYPIESLRIAAYTTLIINIRQLSPEKASFYLQSIIDMSRKTNRPKDKYDCFLAINNYYLFKKDYGKALVANDSLIECAKILAPHYVPGLYRLNAQLYEIMGKYKEGLDALKTSYELQDSLSTAKTLEQLNKLQVQYDLDKLNFEKSQLEIKNKQIMLVSLSIVLLISIFVSAYLYHNLKREKAMKARLRLLKTKAEESENMKTAFINSICHEIRTPLNSIVGFTDLLFDESIDEEMRHTFPKEVQQSTQLLTELINSMLEVSNLDVSDEKLPCELVDIASICHTEIERIQRIGKSEISFLLAVSQEPLMLSTNEQYLALVIENLLNNANKFTPSGSVTLEYHIDRPTNCLQISVSDTGCGIPPEKYEEVFGRFIKLNAFTPGSGLGLYLCRLIVKRLSGNITIDAEYKTGTRIVVSLPVS